jgi:hypothetical protein
MQLAFGINSVNARQIDQSRYNYSQFLCYFTSNVILLIIQYCIEDLVLYENALTGSIPSELLLGPY